MKEKGEKLLTLTKDDEITDFWSLTCMDTLPRMTILLKILL